MADKHIVIVGAGAAGLLAARELAQAGRSVTILEARQRCGGRIFPLSPDDFGYAAEGGAEFIHGEAPVTHELLRAAGLPVRETTGTRWRAERGSLARNDPSLPGEDRLQDAMAKLTNDMTVTAFLERHFPAPGRDALRRSFLRMVEGYDAADPDRASILAIRDEWMGSGRSKSSRIVGGYGALVDFLEAECRESGVSIHFGAVVTALETAKNGVLVHCKDGGRLAAETAIVTVPTSLLPTIAFSPTVQTRAAAAADIGYGNVIKYLLRFRTRWWARCGGHDLANLSFLHTSGIVPVWWTQFPAEHAVLTGWLAGPRSQRMAQIGEPELIEAAVASLAESFGLAVQQLTSDLVAARVIDWARDPFARGAYSYATPETRRARAVLDSASSDGVLFAGEALYDGEDMGIVEAAFASGRRAARMILETTR